MKKRELIKIPDNIATTMLLIWTMGFGIVIRIANKKAEKFVMATTATEIPLTQITSRFGEVRGAIFYDRYNYVSSSSRLIGNDPLSKDIWVKYGIGKNNTPPYYNLFLLETPYSLYKEKDNDTIIVIKDGFELKFLLKSDD